MPFITCSLFGTPPEDGAPPWPTFQPLAPWYIQGHEDLWVDIEHVPAALHTFRRELGRMAHTIKPRQDGRGHLVVVSGLRGTGKSSLLHMCVHELVGWLDEAAQEPTAATGPEGGEEQQSWCRRDPATTVHVVPVGGIQNKGGDLESSRSGRREAPQLHTVTERIFRTVVDQLNKDPEFAAARGPNIDSPDHYLAWRALTDALATTGRRLAVIVPHIRWDNDTSAWEFLRFCHKKADRGVVFFVETEYTRLEAELKVIFDERERRGVTLLKTDKLESADWGKYLRHWMEIEDIPGPRVTITDDLLEYEPAAWVFVSISKLQDCLRRAAEEAVDAHEGHLGRKRMVLWFNQNKPNPDDFLKEPPNLADFEREHPDSEEDRRDEP
ncbi:ATP-binding protein [Streptomyces sp. NPDC086549]|uniref:ATP-binding protein n=1 Tax=Streptomyces sp. NPDC086549 TaxID=3365752 RepID=UPI0037F91A22